MIEEVSKREEQLKVIVQFSSLLLLMLLYLILIIGELIQKAKDKIESFYEEKENLEQELTNTTEELGYAKEKEIQTRVK